MLLIVSLVPQLSGSQARRRMARQKQTEDRIPSILVGIAGVHYVAAELSLRGLVALPTIRNTAGYDIIVATQDGSRHANIQVKASQKRVSFWPMPPSEKVCAKAHDYYVLVRWLKDKKRFQAFMLRGVEAKMEVRKHEHLQRQRRGPKGAIFPCIWVGEQFGSDRWEQQWESWHL
jgi:hypothetical protein